MKIDHEAAETGSSRPGSCDLQRKHALNTTPVPNAFRAAAAAMRVDALAWAAPSQIAPAPAPTLGSHDDCFRSDQQHMAMLEWQVESAKPITTASLIADSSPDGAQQRCVVEERAPGRQSRS
jgi:hypothetical protein